MFNFSGHFFTLICDRKAIYNLPAYYNDFKEVKLLFDNI